MSSLMNKIQIARGNFSSKKILAYGELFYDKSSRNILIGAKDADTDEVVTKRVGGADGLVLKDTLSTGKLPEVTQFPDLVAGDTYFLKEPIFFIKGPNGACSEIKIPSPTESTKDLITWEKDSIIIYLGPDVNVANSEVVYNNWLYVNSSFLKADHIKFDVDNIESLNVDKATLDNVQAALEYLFHTNMAYAGDFGVKDTPFTGEKEIVNGSFAYYKGEDGNIKVKYPDGTVETINDVKENSLIIRQDNQNYVIPLGAADASGIAFIFTQAAEYNDTVDYGKHSINADGSSAILNKEADINTVTKAIDWLNGKKADLNADGKIPLEQIPSTLIGALQFKGTIDITALIAESGLGKDHITDSELVQYVKDTLHYDEIDEGDYIIFTKTGEGDATVYVGPDTKNENAYNSGDWAIYLPTHPEESPETMEADHWERINASAAVDNVNGCMASVKINGAQGIDVDTVTSTSTITISNGYLLSDENCVPENHVPIKAELAGEHSVKDSRLEITRKNNDKGLTFTDADQNIEITMKNSGDIATLPDGAHGTKNKLAKFNDAEQLVDSIVTNQDNDVKIGDNSSVTVKTGNSIALDVHIEKGGETPAVNDHFKFEEGLTEDAKATPVTVDNPATLLTDASVIDCGEWI